MEWGGGVVSQLVSYGHFSYDVLGRHSHISRNLQGSARVAGVVILRRRRRPTLGNGAMRVSFPPAAAAAAEAAARRRRRRRRRRRDRSISNTPRFY